MKTCTKCQRAKPLTDFYANPRVTDGVFGECKECNRSRAREWQRRKRASDPTYAADVKMRQLYGITLAQYEEMLAVQGGRCAICRTTQPGGKGRFHVDHDHDTGAVRGLLCHPCNVGLGNLGEDVDRLMAAAAYLLTHRAVLPLVVF